MRAGAAKGGLYGNDAIEAMYPYTRMDATGETLDGSKHNYTITFPAGQLPPVNAFWSVTMYDGKSQLLIKNPINRYLINSPMLPDMKKNDDGSLTLYIQKDTPGADKETNWLPAPNDTIYLVMRLYWPKTRRLRSCRPAKARGSRRASWHRSSDAPRRSLAWAPDSSAPRTTTVCTAVASRRSGTRVRCRLARELQKWGTRLTPRLDR